MERVITKMGKFTTQLSNPIGGTVENALNLMPPLQPPQAQPPMLQHFSPFDSPGPSLNSPPQPPTPTPYHFSQAIEFLHPGTTRHYSVATTLPSPDHPFCWDYLPRLHLVHFPPLPLIKDFVHMRMLSVSWNTGWFRRGLADWPLYWSNIAFLGLMGWQGVNSMRKRSIISGTPSGKFKISRYIWINHVYYLCSPDTIYDVEFRTNY